MSYTPPQSTKITSASNVLWSSGALFSGYILLGLALPTDALGYQWAELRLYGTSQRLPEWTVIPIVEGVIDNNTSIFLTSQLDPPNTRYVAYWYDNTWKRIYPYPIGVLPTAFTVSTNPYIITPPTLTVPTVPTAALYPDPQDDNPLPYAIPTEYTLTGTVNGVNTVFTIPIATVVFACIFLDGQKQKESEDYSRSGNIVTFTTAPLTGSQVMGLII